jgi:hypothetical protein
MVINYIKYKLAVLAMPSLDWLSLFQVPLTRRYLKFKRDFTVSDLEILSRLLADVREFSKLIFCGNFWIIMEIPPLNTSR